MAITFTLYFCFKGTVSRDFRPNFYIQISTLVPFEQTKTVCRIFRLREDIREKHAFVQSIL